MYKIDVLLKQNRKLFHTSDLSILWGTDNLNTLYTTIKRYIERGILIPVHKGLYSVIPLDQLDPIVLGMIALHTYAYVSCETVLTNSGINFQSGEATTLVSSVSKRFSLAGHTYIVRKMTDRFLYNDAGVQRLDGVLTASLLRAVTDMLYFHPTAYFDNPKSIDWKAVHALQKEVGFK